MRITSNTVVWFSDVDKDDVALVGGKGANLGEMVKNEFPVPEGFIVTATAYFRFLKENNLATRIKHLLSTVNFDKAESLLQVSNHIKKSIIAGHMPADMEKDIMQAYFTLGGLLKDALVAVRSSATAEDLPTASFAGQQETFLNVKGETNVIIKIKETWASLFNSRAIFYRHEQHFDHFKVGIAVPVQKMVESEQSGIMFTIDPVTNDKTKIVIEAIFGLGELIVQGEITPDHYEVTKSNFDIAVKNITTQTKMLKKVGIANKEVPIPKIIGERQKITDKHIRELARLGKKLEKHYYFPQDSEWAIEKGKIYIVQTRPITTIHKASISSTKEEKSMPHEILVKGAPASPGIATGKTRVIKSAKEIGNVLMGEVLVAPQTNPDFVPAMKRAVAIVTDLGGRTSHAAIVSRELGIPAVVGSENATKVLKNGLFITVNGTKGEVYKGGFAKSTVNQMTQVQKPIIKTATKVYVNLAEPEFAQRVSKRHVDGVGLLRAEFMMAGIGVHPKKLIPDG